MTTNTSILLSFLKLGNREFLSGETLATEHGISRVAINARIKKLGQSGIVFEAVPRRGYRLAKELLPFEDRIIEPDLSFLERDEPSLFSNGRQVCVLTIKGGIENS